MPGLYQNYGGVPNATGGELLKVDLPSTALNPNAPGEGVMSAAQIAGCLGTNYKNLLIGGDFSTNPWQRGTSFTGIANTLTYTADRFFARGGASSSISVSRQSVAVGEISASGNTFTHALQFGRANSNSNTAAIFLGQVLESANSVPLQGRQVTLSFWARSGANFSAAGGFLGLQVVTGTGTDQSAANAIDGAWTGFSNRPLSSMANGTFNTGRDLATGNPTTGISGGVLLTPTGGVNLTTAWQRFQVTCSIPANATQVGIMFNYVPVGTAGANDWFQLIGVQLEAVSSLYPNASPFETRWAGVELALAQRFTQAWAEPAANVPLAVGMQTGAAAQTLVLPLSVQMRAAPTMTIPAAGTFRVNIAGTQTAVTLAAATSTPSTGVLTGGASGTAGQAVMLTGNGGAGLIIASAEL